MALAKLIPNPRLLVPPHFLFQFSISDRVLFVCSSGAVDVPSRGKTSVTTSGLILTIRNRWSWVVYKVGLPFRRALFSKEIRWGGLGPYQVFSSVLMVKGWKPDCFDAQAVLGLQIRRCKRPLFISRDGWYDPIFHPLKALDGDARQSQMDFDNSFPLVLLHGSSFCLEFELSRNKILISVGAVEMAVKDIVPSILTWKINCEVKKPWKIDGIAGFAPRPHGRRRCHDTKVEGEDFCDISLSKGQKPCSFSKHGLQMQIHCWNLPGLYGFRKNDCNNLFPNMNPGKSRMDQISEKISCFVSMVDSTVVLGRVADFFELIMLAEEGHFCKNYVHASEDVVSSSTADDFLASHPLQE
ncbi:hypothetical protein V6N13_050966 [Hibiscus sabdariffa]|uniref:Uncharacterized protein n=1 Tax=Hibiscus sabdariffa TaxID=183260 RepID=A0ABR2T253_9ROSI